MMSSDYELTDTGRLEATRNQKKRSSDTVAVNEAAVAIKLIQTGAKDELRLLLKENNSLVESAVDWVGDGLLAIAAWHGMPEIVLMLLNDFSANVNAENLKKATPLHRASAGGCSLCVEILLNKGADVEFCDATGRKPIDVGGNDAVRELIRERIRVAREMVRQFHISLEKADKDFEEKKILSDAAAKERKISARLSQAVPVIFSGAVNDDANGVYDPIYELHDEWPIYRKRDTTSDIYMMYTAAKNCWVIRTVYAAQNHDEISLFSTPSTTDWRGKALVTLSCETPTFPELRLEGSNGIIEEGGSRKGNCVMAVTSESEWFGGIEMEKLKQIKVATPPRDCS